MSYQTRADRARRERCYICSSYYGCTAVLPEDGERLVFGVHRQHRPEAESAKAWPSISAHNSRLVAAANRKADKATKKYPGRLVLTPREESTPRQTWPQGFQRA